MVSDFKRFAPKKSLGQNFCRDNCITRELFRLLSPTSSDLVWEIGPGTGQLTSEIAKSKARLHLFEIDSRFIPVLISSFTNSEVTECDFLQVDLPKIINKEKPDLICGNLPYYCGTAIIKKLLDCQTGARKMVFLLQEEVVSKATAEVNDKNYSYLSLYFSLFSESSTGPKFPPGAFYPPPKVDSALITIVPLKLSDEQLETRYKALKLASRLFAQRRKMALPLLKKSLPHSDWDKAFKELNIDPKARPQSISPQQFIELANIESNIDS